MVTLLNKFFTHIGHAKEFSLVIEQTSDSQNTLSIKVIDGDRCYIFQETKDKYRMRIIKALIPTQYIAELETCDETQQKIKEGFNEVIHHQYGTFKVIPQNSEYIQIQYKTNIANEKKIILIPKQKFFKKISNKSSTLSKQEEELIKEEISEQQMQKDLFGRNQGLGSGNKKTMKEIHQIIQSKSNKKTFALYKKLIMDKKGVLQWNCEDKTIGNVFTKAIKRSVVEGPKTAYYLLSQLTAMNNKDIDKKQFSKFLNKFNQKLINKQQLRKEESKSQEERRYHEIATQYLVNSFIDDFSNPEAILKIFVYLYTAEKFYGFLNIQMALSSLSWSIDLVSLLYHGIKSMIGKGRIKKQQKSLQLFRGIKTQTYLQYDKQYHWPSFTSTSINKNISMTFAAPDGQIFNISTIRPQQTSKGLLLDEWVIDLTDDGLKRYSQFSYEHQILLLPGFTFKLIDKETLKDKSQQIVESNTDIPNVFIQQIVDQIQMEEDMDKLYESDKLSQQTDSEEQTLSDEIKQFKSTIEVQKFQKNKHSQ